MAETEQQRHKQFEQMKKEAYQNQMKQDMEHRTKLKDIDQQIHQRNTEEQLKLFSENAAKEIQREREYKNKFEKFNEKEAAHRDNYKSSVYNAEQ